MIFDKVIVFSGAWFRAMTEPRRGSIPQPRIAAQPLPWVTTATLCRTPKGLHNERTAHRLNPFGVHIAVRPFPG
jgi:hypothetical protein